LVPADLQARVDKATVEITQTYEKTLKEVKELKTKINNLELSITDNADAKTSGFLDQLNSAIDMLIKLTDFAIAESERAWQQHRALEQDCEARGSDPAKLSALKGVCKKVEEFATDLLCYSLAHFKRKGAHSS
jgi:hypothetical protein